MQRPVRPRFQLSLLQAIIFDWDGTLANTRECVTTCLDRTLKKYQQPVWEVTKRWRDTTKSLKGNFPNFFGAAWRSAYQDYTCDYLHSFKSQVELSEGALALLEWLANFPLKLLIISNKDRVLLLPELEYLLPQFRFWKVISEGEALRDKPFPDPVKLAFTDSEVTVEPNRVWLVGDSHQDVDCALAAGCLPILIRQAETFEQSQMVKRPVLNYASLTEFRAALINVK